MTTIREVARQAGVSYATVSHVINETRFVSESTRARVLAAMEALNYQTNTLARSLRKGRTNTLGLILPDSANPYFAEIGRSIEDAAYRLGYSVILCNTERDTAREEHYVDVLSKKQVDGMIFVAAGDQADSLHSLLRREMPVILVDRDLPNIEVDAVLTDNELGGYLAARHLIELGHRKIACIGGPSSITPSADRITGYCKALEEAGVPCDESLVVSGDYHPDSGYHLTRELLRLNSPPSAIFVLNDLMAMGALHAAAELDCRVPQDLAVVGYDNIELARFTNPPLSTVAQEKTELGTRAIQILIERTEDKSLPTRRLVLPPRLIVRGSTDHTA